MKICIIGTGYVGLATGACLASMDNEVTCVDKNKQIVKSLKKAEIHFYEPGLKDVVEENIEEKRLKFTDDLESAVIDSEVIFITVGTPPKKSGEADISAVVSVAKSIAKAIKKSGKIVGDGYKVVVNKSTVPIGMGDIVDGIMLEEGVDRNRFSVASNPEFLKEGSAVYDFLNPDRIVIGASDNKAYNKLAELYRPLNAHIVFTSLRSAEFIKYASNAFLATKVSFINEIAKLCEEVGSDVTEVGQGMGLDKRIGRDYLRAGLGYGGSCLPKDVSALIHLAKKYKIAPHLLQAVQEVNKNQRKLMVKKVSSVFKSLKGKKICVLGLSFKPETDDLREAPSLDIINDLQKLGAKISAYDPVAEGKAKEQLIGVAFCNDIYESIEGVDALIVAAEWNEFKNLDLKKVKLKMKTPIIFDGRNMYDPKKLKALGFRYCGIGR
ncbi:UDP-glucose dehydrogenase family protein [Candidatus Margulisiibacteriota bacterium]